MFRRYNGSWSCIQWHPGSSLKSTVEHGGSMHTSITNKCYKSGCWSFWGSDCETFISTLLHQVIPFLYHHHHNCQQHYPLKKMHFNKLTWERTAGTLPTNAYKLENCFLWNNYKTKQQMYIIRFELIKILPPPTAKTIHKAERNSTTLHTELSIPKQIYQSIFSILCYFF